MGLFKSIKKAFKKVTSGIKKVFKKTLSAINKVQKKIRKSKLFKALVIAGAVIVTGGAAIGAFTGGTATGWAGWMMNASNTIAGGTLFGTGATGLAGTAQAAGNFVTSAIAAPFAAVGAAAGTTAAAATDFVGLTTEAGRTSVTATAQAAPGAIPDVTETVVTAPRAPGTVPGVSETVVTPGTAGTGARTVGPQLNANNTITAQGTAATTPYVSPTLADPIVTTATRAPGSIAPITNTIVTPTTAAAEKLSLAARYPKTTSFVTGAGMTAAKTMFGAYANSLYQGDARINPGGSAEEGASRFSPIAVYSNELNINPDDYYKHFTFSNASEASNMPLFQQQTLAIT